MQTESELFSIVVIGKMNPSIHHPGWYRLVELIDESEFEKACEPGKVIVTPPLTRMILPTLDLTCQENRWEIKTVRRSDIDRILNVTVRVFDELLPHTHIDTYGFNVAVTLSTDYDAVSDKLLDVFSVGKIGIDVQNAITVDVAIKRQLEERSSTVKISPAKKSAGLTASFNFHYDVLKVFAPEGIGTGRTLSFKFGDRLRSQFHRDLDVVENDVRSICNSLA